MLDWLSLTPLVRTATLGQGLTLLQLRVLRACVFVLHTSMCTFTSEASQSQLEVCETPAHPRVSSSVMDGACLTGFQVRLLVQGLPSETTALWSAWDCPALAAPGGSATPD